MSPERRKLVAGKFVEEYYWNGNMVTYIHNRLTDAKYDDVTEETISGLLLMQEPTP